MTRQEEYEDDVQGQLFDDATPPPVHDGIVQEGSNIARPLAVRMRPTNLDEVYGQRHALQEGSPLRRIAQEQGNSRSVPSSVILFGPPGVGKTTLATLVAQQSNRAFEVLSAVSSGVKELRVIVERAKRRLMRTGQETILFIDEVHRFSKSQQDALLPSVENRDITFIAATTENPSFSIIAPLLSRSVVVKLESLDDNDIVAILRHALSDNRGFANAVSADETTLQRIATLSAGDARKSLTILEAAAGSVLQRSDDDHHTDDDGNPAVITEQVVSSVLDVALVRYDKDGDDHYDVASAFIKSMRGSDPDAALHYLARMLRAGEDPRFIARRIIIAASEEVGMAAPEILNLVVSAAQAVALVGMPEARIILGQAVIAVATAPKSNASYLAINKALADVDAGHIGSVPLHLRNAPTRLMKEWGNHRGYRYAHDYPHGIAPQQYMPDELVGRIYYVPTNHGLERDIRSRLATIRSIVHGEISGADTEENVTEE